MSKSKRKLNRKAPETQPQVTEPLAASQIKTVFVIIAAFFAGAAVMIVELAANRILSPWFGNSLYTWTGLIGVILVALSAGYYLGGWIADKRPQFKVLMHLLGLAGLLVLTIPLLQRGLENSIPNSSYIAGPVIASLLMFALPGILLGTVSPFSIRLVSYYKKDQHVGVSAGTIGMMATLGSVVGTFLSGFVLVPLVSLRIIFLAIGGLLVLMAIAGYFMFAEKKKIPVSILLVGVVLFTSLNLIAKEPEHGVIYEKNSYYHRIRVTEDWTGTRTLYLDSTVEGRHYLNSDDIPLQYQKYWELSKVFRTEIDNAAFLGGGAFLMPEVMSEAFPEAQVDVVEIDPKVVEIGRKYFKLDEYPNVNPISDDARRFLKTAEKKYDFIFGDAYNGIRSIPSHLVTQEFFNLVRECLTEDGVYMMNIISALTGERAQLFSMIHNTISREFDHLVVFSTNPRRPAGTQNVILVASRRELKQHSIDRHPPQVQKRIQQLLATYVPPGRYRLVSDGVFTDDYNPVEYIVAQMLE